MTLPGITNVRHDEATGKQLLADFLFGGMLGPGRVPRGVDPALVSKVIVDDLKPGSSADAYRKTLDAARFYELDDVVPHLRAALTEKEFDQPSIRRSAYVLQAVADLGASGDSVVAADYLDRVLVPLAAAMDVMPTLLETRIALAPEGSMDRIAERIQREVDQAALTEMQSEAHMMAFDKVSALQRNDLPRAEAIAAQKVAVQALPEPARRDELVAIYMGRASAVGLLIEMWAARALRREALTVDPIPVLGAFAQEIDGAEAERKAGSPKGASDFLIVRAAQAIIYLGGQLSAHHAKLYADTEVGSANFLWDDP